MSLYEEALVEAKKLKEIAEADAKQAIVEEITPHIRRMIASSLAGKSTSILYEEEEKLGLPDATGVTPVGSPVGDPAGAVDGGTPPPSTDATASAPVAPEPSGDAAAMAAPIGATSAGDAPIQVAGADALNMPMPGPDGKLVVDFDDLFIPSEPGDDEGSGDESPGSAELAPEVPGGLPSPTPVDVNPTPADAAVGADTTSVAGAPGEGEAMVAAGQGGEPKAPAPEPQLETYELFSEALDVTAKRVHKAYSSTGIPSLMKEALQDKLFQLIETLETLTEKKLVSEKLSQILESRLEILHLKLQEAILTNTYEGTKGTDMASKSLKEFASKMISESETIEGGPITSPADVHKSEKTMTVQNANDAAADKAGTHAQKVTEPTVTLKTEAAELAKLEEELRALIAEDEGDSLADDEGKQKNLAGAASSIPDKKVGQVDVTKTPAGGPSNPASYVQGVSENIEHSKETGSEEEVKTTTSGKPTKESVAVSGKALNERTKKLKAEALRKQIAGLQEQLKECGMETEAAGNGLPAPGVPPKKSVMGEEDTVINFNFDLSDLVGGLDGLGDDDEIEIVDEPEDGSEFGADAGASEPSDDLGGSDDLDLGGSEEGSDDLDLGSEEEEEEEKSALPLSERIRAARKPRKAPAKIALAENRALKTQLAEQTLFNAKVVHLQPFLNNRNLTKEQKQKIVEYLDRGKTVNEVKTIYTRVKAVLESAQKAKAKVGSSSRPSGAGAATINESATVENLYEGAVLVEAERNRLMELAGIRRK